MATEDRKVDRKANTESEAVDPDDPRPDLEHFDGFDVGVRDILTGWIPTVPVPSFGTGTVAMVVAYLFVVAGGVSIGYGATALATDYGGIQGGAIVGGVFLFAYGYVGLRFVDAVRSNTEP